MQSLNIQNIGGKWYFNGRLYRELSGKEKAYVDLLLNEVRIENINSERKANPSLKNYNYEFHN